MSHPVAEIQLDIEDRTILNSRLSQWNQRQGPRVGDFVAFADGTLHRFSHDWGEDIQHSQGGSFYLGDGYMSFSGGLEPAIDKVLLRDTGETKLGWCWFFHHDRYEAHNGLDVQVPCRVYEYEVAK